LLYYSIVILQYCYTTVLLHYSIVVLQYCYPTVLLYYSIVVLQYCYTTVLLHYSIVILQYCYTTVLLYYSIVTLQYSYTTVLYYSIVTLQYCYTTVLLYYSIVTLQYCCTTVLLYYSIVTLQYCYITVLLYYSHISQSVIFLCQKCRSVSTSFLRPVDRASGYSRVNTNQLDAQLILSVFRQPLHVVCFLLGNSPASEFCMSTFRNTLSVSSSYLPAYKDGTECSETSAYKIQKLGNYPEESIQHSEHGESLKSRTSTCFGRT
jgi:hypothetical protein